VVEFAGVPKNAPAEFQRQAPEAVRAPSRSRERRLKFEFNRGDRPTSDKSEASIIQIKKPQSFSEKFKSKNAPTISGVETLLTALPILKIGDVGDWTRLHPSEDEY